MSTSKSFKPGDVVVPTSTRCPLEPGKYIVTEFVSIPQLPNQYGVVFVEGRNQGVSAEYLCLHEPGRPIWNMGLKIVDGLRIGCVVLIENIGNAWHECKDRQRSSYKFDDEYTFCPFCKTELVKKVDMSIQIVIENTDDLDDFLCKLRRKIDGFIEGEIKIYRP